MTEIKKRLISFDEKVSEAIDQFLENNPRYYSKGRVSTMVNQAVIDYLRSKGVDIKAWGYTYLSSDGERYTHRERSILIL